MPTVEEPEVTDAAELQNVLTRYVDSIDGYTQAAAVVNAPDLAQSFLEIAQRRKEIATHVAKLIEEEGEQPQFTGSPEAIAHRWWIRLKVGMSDEEFRAVLEECVRGEKELARTIEDTLQGGNLDKNHAEVVSQIARELAQALGVFQSVLHQ